MRSRAHLLTHILSATVLGLAVPSALGGQQTPEPALTDSQRILRRWVGAQLNTLPIWLDFYGDSMVVVSDNRNRFAVDFALTPDSLVIFGDSTLMAVLAVAFRSSQGQNLGSRASFGMRYRFSLDRLLLTAGATTITMSPQSVRARRLEVRWTAVLSEGRRLELMMDRFGNVGRRVVPGGSWVWGKWERDARNLVFDWSPDSLETPDSTLIWLGIYDAGGEQIVLESIGAGTGATILRRVVR